MKVGDVYRNFVTHNLWRVKAIDGKDITLESAHPSKLHSEFDTTTELMQNYERQED